MKTVLDYPLDIYIYIYHFFLSINIGMLKKKPISIQKVKNYMYVFFLCVVELFNIKQTKNETTRTIYYKDITIFICPL